jgi:hypothetical protein
MDSFRTQVIIPESPDKISYQTQCLLLGSCFSDYIGEIMTGYKFPALLNPFGTLFNPMSMADNLEKLVANTPFTEDNLHFHNGLWFSFSHYTGFSHPNRTVCLQQINDAAQRASLWLKNCHYLILTFGTAWCYIYKPGSQLVANCHKIPAASFERTFANPQNISDRYNKMLALLRSFNPSLHIIFTLSPVRHWKDGAVNNQLSKSALHCSIHEILRNNDNTSYFPAYEIFMDELRDYRFYAVDMLHPSEQATRYVWERFCKVRVDRESEKIMEAVASIARSVNHQPKFSASDGYQHFRQNTLNRIEQLRKMYPFLDFSSEINMLSTS